MANTESRFNDRSPWAGENESRLPLSTQLRGMCDPETPCETCRNQRNPDVMGQSQGLNLDRVVQQQGQLRVPEAVDYVIQAARVLEVAHTSGIVHGDIRPATITVDSNEIIRLLGPELSRTADVNDSLMDSSGIRVTQSSADTAAMNYMAPERTGLSSQVDHRADIYSLGCTLFYLLTGREPLPEEIVKGELVEREPPALRVVRPDVSSRSKPLTKRWSPGSPKSGRPR